MLSTHRHALARQLGGLPGKEDKAGGKLRFCFETQQVDGAKMFATAMGKEADAKTFNRSGRRRVDKGKLTGSLKVRP